jgi:hypothetical protein
MNYYKIVCSTEINVIGIFDQVQHFHSVPFGEEERYHLHKKIPYMGELDFKLKIPNLKLEQKAKFTDFLNVIPYTHKLLTISEKLIHLLGSFNSDIFDIFETSVIRGETNVPYFAIYFPFLRDQEYIDWGNTTFDSIHQYNYGSPAINVAKFKNFDEYFIGLKVAFSKKQYLYPTKLILNKPAINKDIFRLTGFNHDLIISERLKDAFEANNITGRRYINVDDLLPQSNQP